MSAGFSIEEHPGNHEPDWKAVGNPFSAQSKKGNHTIPTIPSHLQYSFPKDSILSEWMNFARKHCENTDFQILGAILPVCSSIIGRSIRYNLFGWKYPNLYSMIVAAPGHRKSTLIGFSRKLAKRIQDESRFMDSMTSEEALFEQFDPEKGGNPDQFLIEDEGNTLFTNWAETNYGKVLSKRFLRLYDCGAWSQSFKGNKVSENDSVKRVIPETSANLLVGATFNVCRMQRLEVRDGMWRRFLKFPSEELARELIFPEPMSDKQWNDLAMEFERLAHTGEEPLEYTLSEKAKKLYTDYRRANSKKLAEVPNDLSPANEAKASVLSEEMSFLIKLSIIFERCRWAKSGKKNDRGIISESTLSMAYELLQHCNTASDSLENIAKRSEIRDVSDSIRANVLSDFSHKAEEHFIPLTKTELTNRFAKNSGRRGAMNNNQLYGEIMPDLIKRNLATLINVKGSKKQFYLFKLDDE